jgi:hypothetical protein
MTLIFYIIIGIITFIAFLHAAAKKEFDISRTVVINCPKEEIFNIARQLKKERLWMPWFADNYNGILKYKGEDGKIDAFLYWKGHNRFYEGIQSITKIHHGKIIETKFSVVKPFKLILLDYKGLKAIDDNKTKMVWGVKGYLAFPLSVLALIQPVDKAYGKELELGLKKLKTMLEAKNKPKEFEVL